MRLKLTAILCLMFGVKFSSQYTVPDPTFEVYRSGGFKVSIPDAKGVSVFAFHGNINKPIRGLEAGQFSVDVTKPENNRWTYENPVEQLNIGDVIYYWLFVIRNGLGHQLLDKQYTVTEYAYEPNCTVVYNVGVGNCVDQVKSLEACMNVQSKVLDSLVVSQNELRRLQTKLLLSNDQSLNKSSSPATLGTAGFVAENLPLPPNAAQYQNALLLGGNLPRVVPSEANHLQLVNFIIWEKLGLVNVDAIAATRYMGDDTYIFELLNSVDKQTVLDASKIKLSDSTIYIRNFEK